MTKKFFDAEFFVALLVTYILGFILYFAFHFPILVSVLVGSIISVWVRLRWRKHSPQRAGLYEMRQKIITMSAYLAQAREMTEEGYPLQNAMVWFRGRMIESGWPSVYVDQIIDVIYEDGIETFEVANELILDNLSQRGIFK